MNDSLPEVSEAEPDESSAAKSPPLIDSLLRVGGPMPPASLRLRMLAYSLDYLLLSIAGSVIIWKLILPSVHPGAFAENYQYIDAIIAWLPTALEGGGAQMPTASPRLIEAYALANELQMAFFWIYFAFGEAFFSGSTLGKRFCRIRSISTITLDRVPMLSGFIRGGMKAIITSLFPPLFIGITALIAKFNSRNQMGHDFLSRTAVIDERLMNQDKKDG